MEGPAYRLGTNGFPIRNRDGKPLVMHAAVRELNRLDGLLESCKREVTGTVGGLTVDPEAVKDIERAHSGDDDDEPESNAKSGKKVELDEYERTAKAPAAKAKAGGRK